MKLDDKKQFNKFRKALLKWYRANCRDLPWRRSGNPYHIWISEVMLQQTQVATVIPYYKRFLSHFPTVAALAAADQQRVLKMWEGLGYYARARNLQKAAQTVLEKHDGKVPDQYDAFRKLIGVGPYIGAAVQSIAFGHPYAVVDGNVKRVLARLFELDTPVNDSSKLSVFQDIAEKLIDKHSPGDYNQGIMELGALICRPQKPDCTSCPVQAFCSASQNERQQALPIRKKRKKVPKYALAAGVVFRDKKMLIVRRPEDGLLGGLWEFPSGKISKAETPQSACSRHIRETTGIETIAEKSLIQVKHAFTHFKIEVAVFACKYHSGEIDLNGPIDGKWVSETEIQKYPFSKVGNKIIQELKKRKAEKTSS